MRPLARKEGRGGDRSKGVRDLFPPVDRAAEVPGKRIGVGVLAAKAGLKGRVAPRCPPFRLEELEVFEGYRDRLPIR